jgi:hypothetical protein
VVESHWFIEHHFQFSPEADWGPGDRAYQDDYTALQYRKAFRCKQHPYGAYQPGTGFTNFQELFHTQILNAILNRIRIDA